MKKENGVRVYVNRWPAWLDLENIFIRSRFTTVYLGGAVTAVCRFLDGLATSKLFYTIIPTVITGITRAFDEAVDSLAVLIGNTLLAKQKTPRLAPVGTRLTYGLGRTLDTIAAFLNRTVLKRHPLTTDFEYRLDVDRREVSNGIRMLRRSVSFGLLLLCIGLFITCWYLLK